MSLQFSPDLYVVHDESLRQFDTAIRVMLRQSLEVFLFSAMRMVHLENREATCLECAVGIFVIIITGGQYGEHS